MKVHFKIYGAEIDSYTDEKIIAIKQEAHSKRGTLAHIKKEISERALSIGRLSETSPPTSLIWTRWKASRGNRPI